MKYQVMVIRKEELVKFLKGHAAAEQRIEQERARRLRTLTVEAARQEYTDLSHVWYSRPHQPEVDPDRLAVMLHVRHAMGLLARLSR